MVLDTEFDTIPPTNKSAAPSPAAERMRRCRRRRRNGLRCLTIQLRKTEIDGLVWSGLLKAETRNDLNAVRESVYAYLERTLDSKT